MGTVVLDMNASFSATKAMLSPAQMSFLARRVDGQGSPGVEKSPETSGDPA